VGERITGFMILLLFLKERREERDKEIRGLWGERGRVYWKWVCSERFELILKNKKLRTFLLIN